MFESVSGVGPSPEAVARLGELFERRYPSVTAESAVLVDGICAAGRAENRAAAAQLSAIGQLFAYRLSRCAETQQWAVDTEAAVAAEVGAALRIGAGLAASRVRYARAMRERLPQVGAVFAAGEIDLRMFVTIVFRTDLIVDPEVLAAVDAALGAQVARWPALSRGRLAAQVDKVVARVDADAVRRRAERVAKRGVWITDSDDGLAQVEGVMFAAQAHALDKRLDALAATVCAHDPRTVEQRRADALGALAAGAERLGCGCGRADCGAGKRPASPVVIHLIAGQASVDGAGAPGVEIGGQGLIAPELIAELAASAKLVPLIHPGDAPPEPGYTPSAALAAFVRCRDLTCRAPGCDRPATDCDLDHTIAYADGGPTHASNLKALCRTHHLLKTFWGWRDKQLPDATVIWMLPDGQTYVTIPGSALLFPTLCAPTGDISPPTQPGADRCGERTAMMPKRGRTRAQNRAHRIAVERKHNRDARLARRDASLSYSWPGAYGPDDDPPPF